MHRHEHERESPQRHPIRRSGADEAATALAARAAAAGRTDALGHASVLRLQRAAGNAGVARLLDGDAEQDSPVKDVVGRGGGTPMEPAVRQRMESSFGADFSDVRVHTGGSAAASARAVDAHAYTVGNEIVLGDGHAQGSPVHDRTLAHELTHVVQQRSGPVEGTPAPGGISVSNPAIASSSPPRRPPIASCPRGRPPTWPQSAAPSIQREAAPEDEEEVQALAIQREAAPEDEEEVQALAIQREAAPEDEEEVQTLAIQREAARRRGGPGARHPAGGGRRAHRRRGAPAPLAQSSGLPIGRARGVEPVVGFARPAGTPAARHCTGRAGMSLRSGPAGSRRQPRGSDSGGRGATSRRG